MSIVYPCLQIAPDTWEINEFDCASMFLLVGKKRALLIDTGIGIGLLSDFIRKFTSKPIDVLLTHNHRDHVGNAPSFPKVHISTLDHHMGPMLRPLTTLDSRLEYARHIRTTHQDRFYPWLEGDLSVFFQEPETNCIEDGFTFDLGGRTVTCYHTPGHTPGSLSAVDSQTGILFCGDSCNRIVGLGVRPIEGMRHASIQEALYGLERLWQMNFDHDLVYNAHADFRTIGKPLDNSVYPTVMEVMEHILSGHFDSQPKHIASIHADVEIVTYKGVELQFHRENIYSSGMSLVKSSQ